MTIGEDGGSPHDIAHGDFLGVQNVQVEVNNADNANSM